MTQSACAEVIQHDRHKTEDTWIIEEEKKTPPDFFIYEKKTPPLMRKLPQSCAAVLTEILSTNLYRTSLSVGTTLILMIHD